MKGARRTRAKGITYDTGFLREGAISRERLDLELVQRELLEIFDAEGVGSSGVEHA